LKREDILNGAREINVNDWAQCQVVLSEIRLALEGHDLLYRGIADSELELTTTLERAGCDGMTVHKYFMMTVHGIRPAIHTRLISSIAFP